MIGTVPALSGDGVLLDQLVKGRPAARVHSVFDRAVNLVFDEPVNGRHGVNVRHGLDMLTLITAGADDAPHTLVTAAHSFGEFSLTSASRVSVASSTLSVGNLVVDFGRVRRWQPVLPAWVAQPGLLSDLERIIDAEGAVGGIRTSHRLSGFGALSAATLSRTALAFESALEARDLDAAYRHGSQLVGLGGGLTPAGDDYLLGMCTALALPGAGWDPHRRVLRRIVDNQLHRTNDISRVALVQASQGRVRESIIDLVRALVGNGPSALTERARRVLAIGHTSGTDIATGLLAGLRLRLRVSEAAQGRSSHCALDCDLHPTTRDR